MVIELARPYDEEEAKRMLQRARYQPQPMQTQEKKDPIIEVAKAAGADVAGKIGMKGADMAIDKGGSFLGKMFAPKATAAMGGASGGASPLLTGLGGEAAKVATTGATTGGAGMMAALASNPIGWAIGLGLLGKRFGLFNEGGAVHANMGGLMGLDLGKYKGPLASMLMPQYKEHGGMTAASGPLSNNKSVKMERKETIEYKN
tara:strand:- start:1099 stop:1707 length:609 start_codon:yes stop_codon:yes gene_type:complete